MSKVTTPPQNNENRWTIIKRQGNLCIAECVCGTRRFARADHIDSGRSKSCGCWRREWCSILGKQKKPKEGKYGK